MNSMDKLQAVHDRLVASQPEGAEHSKDDCPFCNGEFAALSQGGSDEMSDKTFSEAEVTEAVAKATADLRAELDQFKQSQEAAAVETRVQTVTDEKDAEIAELQVRIDALTAEAEAAKADREAITTWLEAEAAKVTAEAEAAARMDARVAQVAEVITLPAERVEERKAVWASLDETAFEALLADYKALDMKAEESKEGSELPAATAMQATRSSGGGKTESAVAELIRGRQFGVNIRDAR